MVLLANSKDCMGFQTQAPFERIVMPRTVATVDPPSSAGGHLNISMVSYTPASFFFFFGLHRPLVCLLLRKSCEEVVVREVVAALFLEEADSIVQHGDARCLCFVPRLAVASACTAGLASFRAGCVAMGDSSHAASNLRRWWQ